MITLSLLLSLMALPPAAFAYIVWAGVRAASRGRRTDRHRRGSVVFHSLWGMALSLPGFLMAASGGLSDGWHWVGRLLGVALLGCWVLAVAAIADRRIPPVVAWWPLATVIVSYTFYAVQSGSVEGATNLSGLGFGLAAWLLVAINFATSLAGVDRNQPPTRAFARYPAPPRLAAPSNVEPSPSVGHRQT